MLNLGYSFGWKNIPILDIAILVSGFLLRMLLGTTVTGIAISGWLYLTVTLGVVLYGAGQATGRAAHRQQEFPQGAPVLQRWVPDPEYADVPHPWRWCFYSLWSMDRGENLMWTVPLVICICLKYSMTVEGNSDGDPVEVIYQDKVLMLLIAAFAAVTLALLYW